MPGAVTHLHHFAPLWYTVERAKEGEHALWRSFCKTRGDGSRQEVAVEGHRQSAKPSSGAHFRPAKIIYSNEEPALHPRVPLMWSRNKADAASLAGGRARCHAQKIKTS